MLLDTARIYLTGTFKQAKNLAEQQKNVYNLVKIERQTEND